MPRPVKHSTATLYSAHIRGMRVRARTLARNADLLRRNLELWQQGVPAYERYTQLGQEFAMKASRVQGITWMECPVPLPDQRPKRMTQHKAWERG